jgi:hypothetical protein
VAFWKMGGDASRKFAIENRKFFTRYQATEGGGSPFQVSSVAWRDPFRSGGR